MLQVMKLSWSQWLLIFALLFFSATIRFARLSYPSGYYFDEVYHALTAKLISRNDPRAYEWDTQAIEPNTAVDWLHPPLAKLTQAAGIQIFGENSFGWRASSALFGTLLTLLIVWLALELGLGWRTAGLAAFLYNLDGLALTTSRIAMNDIHVTFFFVLALIFYVRWKKTQSRREAILTAFSAGLAIASKWSGVFTLLVIGADVFFTLIQNGQWRLKKNITEISYLALCCAILVPALYLAAYQQMFLQGKDLQHFIDLHKQVWWYQTHLEATHPYQSVPIEWVLDLKPVYAFAAGDGFRLQNIYMLGNPLIFWGGFIAVLWSLSDLFIDKSVRSRLLFLLLAYGLVWLPWALSPRIMFFYHYLPAVPLLCILLAYQLVLLFRSGKGGQVASASFLSLTALTFLLFLPHWTALSVSAEIFKPLYFLLPSWQ